MSIILISKLNHGQISRTVTRLPLLLGSAVGILAQVVSAVAAPPVPNAGEILKTVPPSVPAPPTREDAQPFPSPPAERAPLKGAPGVTVTVKHIVISGNTAFPQDQLLPLVQDAIGKTLDFDGLMALAQRITQFYRDHGHLLARAYLPAQDITAGTLEIAVLEGRYGQIRLDNHSRVSDGTLLRELDVLAPGQIVEAGPLEHQLLLLSDLPGTVVSSTLQPGATTGTSDLVLRADNAPALSGSASVDNWGNRYTGALRAAASMDWASPLGIGDRVDLYGMGSERGGTQFGRVAYDLPVSASGTRIGTAYSYLNYALGLDFSALGAHGNAEITSLYLSQPLARGRQDNSTLQVNFDHRLLRDFVDSTAGSDAKQANVVNLGVNGDHKNTLGSLSSWNATLTGGRLTLDPVTAAEDALAYRTAGDYYKLNAGTSHLQPLGTGWALYGALSGQWADKNLDMSEKFSMGGPTGVRAYPVGEAMADDAWLGTLEIRYALSAQIQLAGFADGGQARLNHSPLPTDITNQRNLSGLGLGAAWNSHTNLSLLTYFAWRTGEAPTSAPDRHPTVWAQLTQTF